MLCAGVFPGEGDDFFVERPGRQRRRRVVGIIDPHQLGAIGDRGRDGVEIGQKSVLALERHVVHLAADKARLAAIFAQPAFEIMPVPMRPTNTGEANASEPLSAHDGYQRERACKEIAVLLENRLRSTAHFKEPVAKHSPLSTLLLLAEPQPPQVELQQPQQKKPWWSRFVR